MKGLWFDQFLAKVPILYHLKTPEYQIEQNGNIRQKWVSPGRYRTQIERA